MKRTILLFIICICFIIAAVYLPADWFLWNDVPNHWAEKEINQLRNKGIPFPFPRSSWDESVTRGEFCSLLVSGFQTESGDSFFFSDVPETHPYYSAIHTACQSGFIAQGEFFRPDEFLTRRELLLICNNLIPLDNQTELKSFATDVEEPLQNLVSCGVQMGFFNLYEDGTFRPEEPVSKAAAACVICRVILSEERGDSVQRAQLLEYLHAFAEGKDATSLCVGTEAEFQQFRTQQVLPFFQKKDLRKQIKDLVLTLSKEGGNASFLLCYADGKERKGEIEFITEETSEGVFISDTVFRLRYDQPIRLIWEYASRPDMDYFNENKANIVSPTWFKLINEKETEVLPRDSEITETLYLSDYYSQSFYQEAKKRNQQIWGLCSNGFVPEQTRQVLTDEALRKKLIETLFSRATEYHLDGINLDFENMYEEDRDIFTRFVKECSLYAKETGLFLSADITKIEESSSFYSMCYDRKALSRCTDYLMLMAYDQHPRGSKIPGPIAALDWTEDALLGVLSQVPASQLVLGVPFYTRIWETKEGVIQNAPATSMTEINTLLSEKHLTPQWKEQEKLHYAEYEKDSHLFQVWIEDEASCSGRIDLIQTHRLAGIACWSGGYETPNIWDIIEKRLK